VHTWIPLEVQRTQLFHSIIPTIAPRHRRSH